MELIAVTQAVNLIGNKKAVISEVDMEFVVQFAFRTSDKELTAKLIDELTEPAADHEQIRQKYEVLTGFKPDWIRNIENLLVALELYRIQEEKALKTLSEFLSAKGIPLTEEELREMPPDRVREYVEKNEAMQR